MPVGFLSRERLEGEMHQKPHNYHNHYHDYHYHYYHYHYYHYHYYHHNK